MTAQEFRKACRATGILADDIAEWLRVDRKTLRDWRAGSQPIPAEVSDRLQLLVRAPEERADPMDFLKIGRLQPVGVCSHLAQHAKPMRRYPKRCYERAALYLLAYGGKDRDQLRLVHGVIVSLRNSGPMDHGWVELPGNLVFDGVYQLFFDKAQYYQALSALKVMEYDRRQMADLLVAQNHFGPWYTSGQLLRAQLVKTELTPLVR